MFPYTAFLKKVKNIQVNNRIEDLNRIMKADYSYLCDIKYFLDKINVQAKEDKYYSKMKDERDKWSREMQKKVSDMRKPLRAEVVADAISRRLKDDDIIIGDTGNVTLWVNRFIEAKHNNKLFFSSWLGTMGAGIPGSIGLALASGKTVYGIIGDGSFAMTSMEIITAMKYKLPVKLVVFDNNILGMIKLEEEVMGYPEYGVDLYNPDFSKLAEASGATGIRLENLEDLESKMDEFFVSKGPTVLDVITETDETPMPPKLEFNVAAKYITSILREKLEPKDD